MPADDALGGAWERWKLAVPLFLSQAPVGLAIIAGRFRRGDLKPSRAVGWAREMAQCDGCGDLCSGIAALRPAEGWFAPCKPWTKRSN